jgi:hypothetical protein
MVFDSARLAATDVALGQDWNGSIKLGLPTGANKPAFLATANTNGKLPSIGGSFINDPQNPDAVDSLAAGDHTLLIVTFKAIACGSSALTLPIGPVDGAMLDGRDVTFGESLDVAGSSATVTISCTAASASPSPTPTGSVAGVTATLPPTDGTIDGGRGYSTPLIAPFALYLLSTLILAASLAVRRRHR